MRPINRAMCALLNKGQHEVLGKTDFDLFPEPTARRLRQHDAAATAADEPMVFDEAVETGPGLRTARSTKGPLRDGEGRLIGLFGVAHDVTEQLRAERALRDSEAHYRTVVSVLAEGVLVSDPQGRIISGNPAAARIVGALRPDWQGGALIPPDWKVYRDDGSEMPAEETPLGRVLAGQGPQQGVLLSAIGPQGLRTWFEVSAQPVLSPDSGELLAVVTSFADVTQRKQLDDELHAHRENLERLVVERTGALARAEHFLRTVADSLPGRVSYFDTQLRCRFVNRGLCEWFGMRPEQILALAEREAVHQRERLRALNLLEAL